MTGSYRDEEARRALAALSEAMRATESHGTPEPAMGGRAKFSEPGMGYLGDEGIGAPKHDDLSMELSFHAGVAEAMPSGDYLVTIHANGTISLRWRDPETRRWAPPIWRVR